MPKRRKMEKMTKEPESPCCVHWQRRNEPYFGKVGVWLAFNAHAHRYFIYRIKYIVHYYLQIYLHVCDKSSFATPVFRYPWCVLFPRILSLFIYVGVCEGACLRLFGCLCAYGHQMHARKVPIETRAGSCRYIINDTAA